MLGVVIGNSLLILTTAAIRPLIFDQRQPGRTTRVVRDLAPGPSLAGPSSLAIHSPAPDPIHRLGDNWAGSVSAPAVAAKPPGPCDDPGACRRRPHDDRPRDRVRDEAAHRGRGRRRQRDRRHGRGATARASARGGDDDPDLARRCRMTAVPALAGRDPPAPAAEDALAHARAIAADWRDAGLQVGLLEHAGEDGRPGGCVLVARSPTQVLHCACRPATSRDGRPLWTVEVSLGRCEDDRDGIEHVRLWTVGTAVAGACEPAWRQVLAWIHGDGAPPPAPGAAPVPPEWWRGWAAGAARCRSRLRTVIGRHLVAPGLAGAADRLR